MENEDNQFSFIRNRTNEFLKMNGKENICKVNKDIKNYLFHYKIDLLI